MTGAGAMIKHFDHVTIVVRDVEAAKQFFGLLVFLDRSNATYSRGMLGKPLPHFLIRPSPLKRVGVESVVLRGTSKHMLKQLLPTDPGTPFQVAVCKSPNQQLRLIQPGGMHRSETRTPPPPTTRPVGCRRARGMAGIAVLNQKHALHAPVPAAKRPRLPDIVVRILAGLGRNFHPTGVDDQEKQQVDDAVARVLKLLLLDGARDGASDRVTLQHLKVGLLIDRNDPEALASQPFRMGIAPKDLLGALLELLIEAGGPPVTGAVRLQVHV